MPQNRLLASAVLALLPLQLIGEAQAQAPAAPAAAGGARSGGRGLGDSRGLGDQFLRSPSDQLKLTERFTRIDPEMIDYRIRVEDLATWTAPCTVRFTITQQPKYQLNEYSCHEGNGALGYALSGERAFERLVVDAKTKGQPIPPRTMGMEV